MPTRYVPTGNPRHKQAPGPKPETLALAAEAKRLKDAGVPLVKIADMFGTNEKRIRYVLQAAEAAAGGVDPERVRQAQTKPRVSQRPSWNWMERAACKGLDLALFFGRDGERGPGKDRREKKAKAVCEFCPVRTECLDYAIGKPSHYGTWGGLGEDERAVERRRRQRAGELRAAS